ncbi:hypothetical protein [Paenibacillus sp. MBLB4367]|uniref:hypothetical protein n=1 Tax=Paenibacillus sp. MBLB4367 TaxID=3384767 RepID=UPI003907EA90
MMNNGNGGTSSRFHRVGVPVRADETRSAAVCRDKSGRERIVIVARGYALIVDPVSGACRQLEFEEGKSEYPYAAMSGRTGLFYTGAGPLLAVLDPFRETFVSRQEPVPGEVVCGFAFAEDKDRTVYATTYPSVQLLHQDPASGQWETLAQLDPAQKYAMSLAAGDDGWVYAGIGTASAGIAACRVSDGAVLALCKEDREVRGSGHVHVGADGDVYGRLPADDADIGDDASGLPGARWFRLRGGKAEPVEESAVSPSAYQGSGYRKLHKELSEGRRIASYELADGELVIEEPDGTRTALKLNYLGGGATLSPMAMGPDGNLYGTSNHPLHLYRYDPAEDKLQNFGGKIVERGGGGNICAYASQGPLLIGAAYAGGILHVLDTRLPMCGEPGPTRNPRLVHADDRIHRPRCALAHPDGEHVLYGGFPGYGSVGGGLGIWHIPSQTAKLYEHLDVVPYQSSLGLAALRNGDVIGGTSVETPGGADPIAGEARLYRFSWTDNRVTERWTPIPGAREISLLTADANDQVYGITSAATLFVFDPHAGTVLRRQDLSAWGSIVRNGLILTSLRGKTAVLGLLSRALFTIDPATLEAELLAELPKEASSGIAVRENSVYFGCGSELWKFTWEEGEEQ